MSSTMKQTQTNTHHTLSFAKLILFYEQQVQWIPSNRNLLFFLWYFMYTIFSLLLALPTMATWTRQFSLPFTGAAVRAQYPENKGARERIHVVCEMKWYQFLGGRRICVQRWTDGSLPYGWQLVSEQPIFVLNVHISLWAPLYAKCNGWVPFDSTRDFLFDWCNNS